MNFQALSGPMRLLRPIFFFTVGFRLGSMPAAICLSVSVAIFAFSAPRLDAAADPGKAATPNTPVGNGNANGASTTKTADDEWNELKNAGKEQVDASAGPLTALVLTTAKNQAIASLETDADKFKDFYTRNPNHPQAAEAKRQEALALVSAWSLGDNSQTARREKSVAEVRKDKSLPEGARAEVGALSDHLGVGKQSSLSRDQKLAAYEAVERALNQEFPDLSDGYEALVNIARVSSDAKAQSLAREIIGTQAAPANVKAEAQLILDRYALLGKSMTVLMRPVLGPANPADAAKNRPLLIYSWGTFSPGSLALAKEITAKAPADTIVVGLNLDRRDLGPAKTMAVAQKLPGQQIYDWLGSHGELATALKLTEPGRAYLADATGLIRNVSAQRDLAAAFAALGNR